MNLTVAVPTWNNPHQLTDTLVSMVRNTPFVGRVIVVNNGQDRYEDIQAAVPYDIDWLNTGKNLGWMGGINRALEYADTDYFCMLNDDVLFPPSSFYFWEYLLRWFDRNDVGGVGPSSNYVAGAQSAFMHVGYPVITTPFLIGFCAVYRTELLKRLGGLDESLPGGDDLDLSIRVQDEGFKLVADRRAYLHHIGAQTGQRVKGSEWDSAEAQSDTANALMRKHGIRRWFECVSGNYESLSNVVSTDIVRITQRAMASQADTIDGLFDRARWEPSDVNEHLDVLYRYASGCKHVVEFGVNDGTSTAAFLAARPERLDSYDIVRFAEIDRLERLAASEGVKFEFHKQSTLETILHDGCDFLFVDDLHTAEHVRQELRRHADHVRKYMFFHDTALCDRKSEDGTRPGIWAAIAEFLREHDEWRVVYTTENLNGLTGLMRVR